MAWLQILARAGGCGFQVTRIDGFDSAGGASLRFLKGAGLYARLARRPEGKTCAAGTACRAPTNSKATATSNGHAQDAGGGSDSGNTGQRLRGARRPEGKACAAGTACRARTNSNATATSNARALHVGGGHGDVRGCAGHERKAETMRLPCETGTPIPDGY